jgi:hypothetical protein
MEASEDDKLPESEVVAQVTLHPGNGLLQVWLTHTLALSL